MSILGQMSTLRVNRIGPYGSYLDGRELGEIMLVREMPARQYAVGDEVKVFVYIDSDDTIVASTTRPTILAGEVGCLEVVALTHNGAFLDWGMRSDLFVPRTEQMGEMGVGKRCVVVALLDSDNERMIGSTRLFMHLNEENIGIFVVDEEVELIVCQQTDLGFKAVVNGTHLGVLYSSEIFQPLSIGSRLKGFVKAPRSDQKIDLILQKPSAEVRNQLEGEILEHLKQHGGVSNIIDKSPPEEIYKTFGCSKKAYKHAIGSLYRSRLITLNKECIALVESKGTKR